MCTVEYQASTPPSTPSAMSSAAIEPTSKRSPGYVRRATATIAGDRSTPKARTPRPSRCAVTRPGPQPRSATARPAPGPSPRTHSAKAASIARSSGLPSSSPVSSAA